MNKPSDLPSTGRDLTDPRCVQAHLWAALGRKVWAVHQLDAGTTGVNLFVRRKSLVATWQALLVAPGSRKAYVAVVAGVMAPEDLVVDAPIGWSHAERRWATDVADAKPALSRFRRLGASDTHSCASVEIKTGRTHQVRVHAASIGHPLVGDRRYGSIDRFARVALHARSVELEDGTEFRAPVPRDLQALMENLGIPTHA